LTVEQRRVLKFVQMSIAETLEATQTGLTFMLAAHLVRQDILQDTWGAETPDTETIFDSMHTIREQMFNSATVFHYFNALDKFIGDIPLEEDNQPIYYRHPTITRIYHFQNEDEARNMTRFTKRELRRLLVLFHLPIKISTVEGYALHREEALL
jgi:hypothetical protein